jgi:outer membrane receptor protein involved in Fe transport
VGTSFKAPSLKSVGGTIPLSDRGKDGVTGQLPNPDLKPESGLSVDAGAGYRGIENLYLGARAFLIQIDDQISTTVVTASGSQSQDINSGKTRTTGLELEVRHSPAGWWQWYGNYTLTQAEVTDSPNPDREGADLSFVPRHVANLGGQLILPNETRFSANLQVFSGIRQDVSKANPGKLDGYELVTARLEKRFLDRDGRELRVYLEPYNLMDNDFEMPWGFQDPGFSTTGGVTVSF